MEPDLGSPVDMGGEPDAGVDAGVDLGVDLGPPDEGPIDLGVPDMGPECTDQSGNLSDFGGAVADAEVCPFNGGVTGTCVMSDVNGDYTACVVAGLEGVRLTAANHDDTLFVAPVSSSPNFYTTADNDFLWSGIGQPWPVAGSGFAYVETPGAGITATAPAGYEVFYSDTVQLIDVALTETIEGGSIYIFGPPADDILVVFGGLDGAECNDSATTPGGPYDTWGSSGPDEIMFPILDQGYTVIPLTCE
ncbi:MAG: hypothetical protein ACFCGT_00945 [Sandaracinaceae bacterium]